MRHITALGIALALLTGCATADDTDPPVDEVADTEAAPQDDGQADSAQEEADDQPDDDAPVDDAPSDDAPADDAPVDDAPADDAPSDDGATDQVDVAIDDFFFDDDDVTINTGDTITWTHEGSITHNVTSRDEAFASDNLSSGDTFSHAFDAAGTFEYVCTLHGQMTATVTVS